MVDQNKALRGIRQIFELRAMVKLKLDIINYVQKFISEIFSLFK